MISKYLCSPVAKEKRQKPVQRACFIFFYRIAEYIESLLRPKDHGIESIGWDSTQRKKINLSQKCLFKITFQCVLAFQMVRS